jgi:molybdate transport system regulatory protein
MSDASPNLTLRLHAWLEREGDIYFGLGRALLLRKIDEHGSLRKASQDLAISYRAAWGKIKAAEERVGYALVQKSGGKWRGYELSDAGRDLLERFDRFYAEVEGYALERARELFKGEVHGYAETYAEDTPPGAPAKSSKRKAKSGRKKAS